jgi:hypothetical protein
VPLSASSLLPPPPPQPVSVKAMKRIDRIHPKVWTIRFISASYAGSDAGYPDLRRKPHIIVRDRRIESGMTAPAYSAAGLIIPHVHVAGK